MQINITFFNMHYIYYTYRNKINSTSCDDKCWKNFINNNEFIIN